MVGALGSWMKARPTGVTQNALDRAAQIVLGMELLGVDLNDQDAPELAALNDADRAVVDQARIWAQARVEETRRRELAQAGAAAAASESVRPAPEPQPAPQVAAAVERTASQSNASQRTAPQPVVQHERRPVADPVNAERPHRPGRTALVRRAEPRAEVVVVDPPWRSGDDIEVLPDRPTTRVRAAVARYEELFWWAICFVAVALLAWRQFG